MGFVRNNLRILIAAALLQAGVEQVLMRFFPNWGTPRYRNVIYFILERVEYPWITLADMMLDAGANYHLCRIVVFVFGSATFFVVMLCCRRLIRAASRSSPR